MSAIDNFIHTSSDRYIRELTEYLAIPSVSAVPEHRDDVRRCAEWTAGSLRHAGLEHVQLFETPGHPIVYGDWLHAPEATTILCYGHYDVQPADPIEQWESPPFQATVRNGRIYARGASDDKGQLFIHVKAIEAHLSQRGRLPVNIRVLVEGEEEVGGTHLADFVRDHGDLLACRAVIDSDSAMFGPGVPSIPYGMRGLVYFQVDLRGTTSDLHSGSFGGAVANPACVLVDLLARLKDEDARITIPGFYDDVRGLSDAERAEFAALPFDDEAYRCSLGAPRLSGEAGYTTLERVWARPTLDVHGLLSGFTGVGAKTVIPAIASAKLSMRLVPDQRAECIAQQFEAHIREIAPPTVEATVTRLACGDPWLSRVDDPFVRAACRALEYGFGHAPVFTREGGSNSITTIFEAALESTVVMFGIGLPSDNPHAPNEHLALDSFQRGIVAAARLYDEIAGIG